MAPSFRRETVLTDYRQTVFVVLVSHQLNPNYLPTRALFLALQGLSTGCRSLAVPNIHNDAPVRGGYLPPPPFFRTQLPYFIVNGLAVTRLVPWCLRCSW